jgi:hypothetical protein
MPINQPGSHHTQKGNTMLKNMAIALSLMFVILASDWIGQNGWSAWLGIPLVIIYIGMIIRALNEYRRGL